MKNFISKNYIIDIFLSIVLLGAFTGLTTAQNCGCAAGLCCSLRGYCGTGVDHCRPGCREGPCAASPNGNGSVSGIVTDAFFDGIAGQAAGSCEAKGFYTRAAFLKAAKSYPEFGTVGSTDVVKREIAAFFAHVTHETIQMCYINEINGSTRDYCDETDKEYPCVSGKMYYGRGPIQLSWNSNYGPAGKSIGFDGLNNPDIVAKDRVISFRTALWYWMKYCHSLIISGKGFGATIRAINGQIECDGGNPRAVSNRVDYFTEYCRQFGIETGDHLRC